MQLVESPAVTEAPTDLCGWPVSQTLVHVGRPQVIQAIQITKLLELAAASGAVIEIAAAVGDTVIETTPATACAWRAPTAGQSAVERRHPVR